MALEVVSAISLVSGIAAVLLSLGLLRSEEFGSSIDPIFLAAGLAAIFLGPAMFSLIWTCCCAGMETSARAADHVNNTTRRSGTKGKRDVDDFDRLPFVYREDYNFSLFGMDFCYDFDSQKSKRVFTALVQAEVIPHPKLIYKPRMASIQDLLLIHSRWYIIKVLHSSFVLMKILQMPGFCCLPTMCLRRKIVEPMLYATGGTILAGRLALEYGWSINLAGGYHHASSGSGSGFCIFADIPLSIEHLKRDFPDKVRKVMIIDLDAHQGNGIERIYRNDNSIYILDAFNPLTFPGDEFAKEGISKTVHVTIVDSDDDYLRKIGQALDEAFHEFSPDIIFYNAGTDCMVGDPIGGLNISEAGIINRDELVFAKAVRRNKPIPICMVLSGGYQMTNAPVIVESIVNLNNRFSLNDELQI